MQPETPEPNNSTDKLAPILASFETKKHNFLNFASFTGQMLLVSMLSSPFERLKLIAQVRPELSKFGEKKVWSARAIMSRIGETGVSQFFKGTRVIFYQMFFFQLTQSKIFGPLIRFVNNMTLSKAIDPEIRRKYDAALSSMLSFLVLYPLDVLKTKQMAEIADPKSQSYKGVYWTYRSVIKG